ncbi:unnamed protein product, partial [marine sediment metagenome]
MKYLKFFEYFYITHFLNNSEAKEIFIKKDLIYQVEYLFNSPHKAFKFLNRKTG